MFLRIIVAILIADILNQKAYAYIDPATGSMLFSVIVCSVTTIFFIFNSFILKLKSGFFFKKSSNEAKEKFVIYSEGNQYYSVFKPVLDEFERRGVDVVYYTSCEDDITFGEKYDHVKRKYIGKGNKAYFKLAFLNADICLMTTPHLDVMQLKRSKGVKHYCHILHSVGFCMNYRLFALDYYDSILCDASFQIPLIRQVEKRRNIKPKTLEVVGSTYMDFNLKRIKKPEKKSAFVVLIAPSWGKYSILNKCGKELIESFKNTNYEVIIRPHPQSLIVDKKLINELSTISSENISWDFSSDNTVAMAKADILISDFSCIMMDYAFLFNKPFLYVDTNINFDILDCADLDEKIPWKYKIVDVIGRKINLEGDDIKNIINIIEEVKNDKNLLENIKKARDYAWENKGEAGKNTVDFMIKTQKELSES